MSEQSDVNVTTDMAVEVVPKSSIEMRQKAFLKSYYRLCTEYKMQLVATVQIESLNTSVFQGKSGLDLVEITDLSPVEKKLMEIE